MEENFDRKPVEKNSKNANAKTAIIIKVLTIACIICAVALAGVIVMAFVNGGGDEPVTSGDINSGEVLTTTDPFITTLPDINNGVPSTETTESTTAVTTTQAPKQSMAYATEEVNVRSEPSTDADLVGVLEEGEGVIYLSDNGDGWYRVMYDNEVCYISADYLTVEEVATTLPADTQTGIRIIDLEHPRWYLVIVDRTRQMPEDFVPETDYVEDSEEELDARVVPYFDKMYNAALEDGIELIALSGYRDAETQAANLDALTEEYMEEYEVSEEEAYEMAVKEILPAGHSEHNLGLAMDIGEIDDSFAESEEYAWLVENAHTYGFIERYTEENQDITGIIPEPWHWRFVGPAHAKKIKAADITLEEYLQQNNVQY